MEEAPEIFWVRFESQSRNPKSATRLKNDFETSHPELEPYSQESGLKIVELVDKEYKSVHYYILVGYILQDGWEELVPGMDDYEFPKKNHYIGKKEVKYQWNRNQRD